VQLNVASSAQVGEFWVTFKTVSNQHLENIFTHNYQPKTSPFWRCRCSTAELVLWQTDDRSHKSRSAVFMFGDSTAEDF